MSNPSIFYENLDLKYSEIAIAMERIDRTSPGLVSFTIPILTPTMDNSKPIKKTVYQNKSNLRNSKNTAYEIGNIELSNTIPIEVPIEVTGGLPLLALYKSLYINHPDINIGVSIPDSIRYIPKGSKWIVVFVGGDITKPRIIAPYSEM